MLTSCREDKLVFPDAPDHAAIYINSTPSGASIFLRNDYTNKITPDWIRDLAPGTHEITLKYNGFIDTVMYITLDTSQVKYLSIKLQEE